MKYPLSPHRFSRPLLIGLILLAYLFTPALVYAEDDFFSLSLKELMHTKVSSASNIEESLLNAPAAMVVISSKDIKQRGYTYIGDVFKDLPGFDFIYHASSSDNILYQRGYRTSSTRRTLLLIDGIVDNDLWSHQARLSRQFPIENIARIEVLYGPSSAVYGPNAFLGIVNIITKKGEDLDSGKHETTLSAELGSYDSRRAEVFVRGNDVIQYSLGAKFFETDGPDLSDDWFYINDARYNDAKTWGPIRNESENGENLNKYYSPSKHHGLIGNLRYNDIEIGLIYWKTDGGFGAYYVGDGAQNNASWKNSSSQLYGRYHLKLSSQLQSKTLLLYRESRSGGDWTEAFQDWAPGQGDYSYISRTDWNTDSNSLLYQQDFEYRLDKSTTILTGLKYEDKDLTKAYDVPGYYGAYSSSVPSTDPGPYGLGAAVGHSQDATYQGVPGPDSSVPSDNRINTDDKGVYLEVVHDMNAWRFNVGIRHDENNIYGSSTNPRLASIYRFDDENGAIKLIYGEAFQEPGPYHLFGGWNGAFANPDLKPEETKNIELILMLGHGSWLHDMSLYKAKYKNVIQEDAVNFGKRDVSGLEYRGRFTMGNFLAADDIEGHLYYSYTDANSSINYDHQSGEWVDGDSDVGDIAPHKIQSGINIPVTDNWNINVRGRFIYHRKLYSRNPLSEQGLELGSYAIFDSAINYQKKNYGLSFSIKNLFDKAFFHPGVEHADSGNDFSQRSQGFRNSLIPQPGRSFWLNFQYKISG